MLKKLIGLTLLFAASSNLALAQTQQHLPKFLTSKKDPYVGAAIGIQNAQGYNGAYGQVFAGLSSTLGKERVINLAGELFFDTGSLPLNNNYYHRSTYGFGASLLPGFIFKEVNIVYLRAGIGTFRLNKTNNFFTGGQLGIGLQTSVNPCTDIRGEYVYTGKGIIRNFGTSRYNFFNLGLIYKI